MLELCARVARAPRAEQWRVVRVLVWLLTIEVLLRTAPLPHVARILGVVLATEPPPHEDERRLPLTAREIRQLRTLRRVLTRWPLAAGPCLREALVAGRLLRHRRPVLCIGAARRDGAFVAHAWLEVGDVVVGNDHGFSLLARAS